MGSLPPITLRLRGWKLIDRVALAFLVLCAIALGAGCGLLFVYASDLPEIRALETYRPDAVTEVSAEKWRRLSWRCRSSGATPSHRFLPCMRIKCIWRTGIMVSRLRRNFISASPSRI